MKLWMAIHRWWNELKIRVLILFRLGREELALYRQERTLTGKTIWVPEGRQWARATILRRGQKRLVISFVDHGGIGTRAPTSVRPRDPRRIGGDKPLIDPRYSGNITKFRCTPDAEQDVLKLMAQGV